MSWLRDKKLVLARKARKSDTNYLHAQLLLAGRNVVRDEIVGRSHSYYFDCGCVRSYTLGAGSVASESVEACKAHKDLLKGPKS